MKNQKKSDLIDAVRDAVTWETRAWLSIAYIGSINIGTVGRSHNDEWVAISHKFRNPLDDMYIIHSEQDARDVVIDGFAEFCEAAGLVPAKAGQDE